MDTRQVRIRAQIARRNARTREPVTAEPDQATVEAAREMRLGPLREHIRKVVDGWPPLTDEQRTQLALLLRPGGNDATA